MNGMIPADEGCGPTKEKVKKSGTLPQADFQYIGFVTGCTADANSNIVDFSREICEKRGLLFLLIYDRIVTASWNGTIKKINTYFG